MPLSPSSPVATPSAVYLVNNLSALNADHAHAEKCYRPCASGAVRPETGLVLTPLFGVLTLVLAHTISIIFHLGFYGLLSSLNSGVLKPRRRSTSS